MNVSIYNLKCIKHTATTSGGLNINEYISWNQFQKAFISERWKGERRTNEESTIFGYAHTKTTVKEGSNRATHLFLFPNTLQEAEQIHAENGDN